MAVMTAQPPLPLLPQGAVEVGEAVALLVDADGGRVFVRGELVFAWDDGDEPARQLAAVQLVRVGAAARVEVAQAFGVNRLTVLRWDRAVRERGVAGLVQAKRGPKGPTKLTPQRVADIRAMRRAGATLASIAEATGVSTNSAARAAAADPAARPAGAPAPSEAPSESGEPGPPPGEGPAVLPVPADPAPRRAERAAARAGLLQAAPPVFTACSRAPLAGLFLALPGLAATGLLDCAGRVYGDAAGGFNGLDTLLLESVLRCLAGEPRAEGASRIDPVALGRVLGMDRAPEVKTIRRRIGALAGLGRAADLQAAVAARTLAGATPDGQAGTVLYADGHVRSYTGTRNIAKTHSARLRFPAPATLETWISDGRGDPVLVVMAQPSASLAGELRRLLPDLRAAVGDDRRVLVGFDRGGWSPALFAHLHQHGFDTLTWRKGPAPDIDPDLFTETSWTDPGTGATSTWRAADTTVDLPVDDTGATFAMRQITRTTTRAGTRQAHVLTTRTDLPAGQVLHLIGSRWRLENYFRYARIHLDLDAHDSYRSSDDDPGRLVPNPARKKAHQAVLAARAGYDRAAADTDRNMPALRTRPAPGITTWTISNTDIGRANAGLRAAHDILQQAEDAYAATPARLPLGQADPGQQVLDTETKLLTHAIRMAAFNTITALARDIRLNTGHPRAADEAHTLARQALAATGDIHPGGHTLTITLDPLPTRRATNALAELCTHLTATSTRYPGTDLTLRYAVKNHP